MSKKVQKETSFCPYCNAEIWYEPSSAQLYFYGMLVVVLIGLAYEQGAWERGYEGLPFAFRIIVALSALGAFFAYLRMRHFPGRWVEVSQNRNRVERQESINTAIAFIVLGSIVIACAVYIVHA